MTATADLIQPRRVLHASVFDRVLIGLDGSEPGFEACRQAALLAPPDAPIEAVSVVHLADVVHTRLTALGLPDQLEEEAEAALERAVEILGERARTRRVNGYVADALLREVDRTHATVLAIGSHGHARAAEILLGGVAGDVLHMAPCSIFVARPAGDAAAFPGPIVVGIDGSKESDAALAAAEQLARRFDASLRILAARRGKSVDLPRVHLRAPLAEQVDEHPVEALVRASSSAGIVVVGSRGLHGLRALGSVSERVAHQAVCSVLVVRG